MRIGLMCLMLAMGTGVVRAQTVAQASLQPRTVGVRPVRVVMRRG